MYWWRARNGPIIRKNLKKLSEILTKRRRYSCQLKKY